MARTMRGSATGGRGSTPTQRLELRHWSGLDGSRVTDALDAGALLSSDVEAAASATGAGSVFFSSLLGAAVVAAGADVAALAGLLVAEDEDAETDDEDDEAPGEGERAMGGSVMAAIWAGR